MTPGSVLPGSDEPVSLEAGEGAVTAVRSGVVSRDVSSRTTIIPRLTVTPGGHGSTPFATRHIFGALGGVSQQNRRVGREG